MNCNWQNIFFMKIINSAWVPGSVNAACEALVVHTWATWMPEAPHLESCRLPWDWQLATGIKGQSRQRFHKECRIIFIGTLFIDSSYSKFSYSSQKIWSFSSRYIPTFRFIRITNSIERISKTIWSKLLRLQWNPSYSISNFTTYAINDEIA